MKGRGIAIISAIILSVSLFGCGGNKNNYVFGIDPSTPSSNIKGPMWKLEDDDSVVYLYGTIHNAGKEIYPLHEDIEKAFEDSKIFVMEQNDEDLDKNALQKAIYYQNGDTMEKHLSKEAIDVVKKYATKYGGNYNEIIKLKPFAYSRSMVDVICHDKSFDPKYGLDNYWFEKAKLNNKKILSLDDYVEVYGDLGNLSDEDCNKLILQLDYLSPEEQKQNGLKMLEQWKKADIESMNQEDEDDGEKYRALNLEPSEDYLNILLFDRNEKWVDKIVNYLNDDENYFVAGGTGHFVGDKSVIDLLEKKGYTVTFLSN